MNPTDILFKAKRVSDGKWIEGYPVRIGTGMIIIHNSDLTVDNDLPDGTDLVYNMNEFDAVYPDTLCMGVVIQGKKVFTRDILYAKFEDKNEEKGYCEVYNEVAFQSGAFGLIGDITGEFLPFSIYPIIDEVVAGNKFDNPELLTKEREG